jgi:hypothetical protein
MLQTVNITVYRADIEFDVQNITDKIYRASKRSETPNQAQARYEDTDQNRAILSRLLKKYRDKVDARLAAYVVTPEIASVRSGATTVEDAHAKDNAIILAGDLTFNLEFPTTWRIELIDNLKTSIHDYLVNSIIFEYLKYSPEYKTEAKDHLDISKENHREIKVCINSRYAETVIRPLQPFGDYSNAEEDTE